MKSPQYEQSSSTHNGRRFSASVNPKHWFSGADSAFRMPISTLPGSGRSTTVMARIDLHPAVL